MPVRIVHLRKQRTLAVEDPAHPLLAHNKPKTCLESTHYRNIDTNFVDNESLNEAMGTAVRRKERILVRV